MIKNNTIYFGQGDILISSRLNNLVIKEMNFTTPIGEEPIEYDIEKIKKTIYIPFNKDSFVLAMKELSDVKTKNKRKVGIGKFVLDFKNYNEKSVDNLLRNLFPIYPYARKMKNE